MVIKRIKKLINGKKTQNEKMKKLNIGCGKTPKKGFVNLDVEEYKTNDITWNLDKFPYPIKDDDFDYAEAIQVMEHLENTTRILEELNRIIIKGGILHIEVPYFRNTQAYAITHKRFFSICMWRILTGEVKATSNINQNLFKIKKIRLSFRLLYRLIGISFFANKFPQVYEDLLGHLFPATDIILDLECSK